VRFHPLEDAIELGGRNRRRLMAMDVDDRKLRTGHWMLRRDQLRLRLVVADGGRRELRLAAFRGPGTLPASAARIFSRFGAAAPEPGKVHDPGDGGREEKRCQGDGEEREWETLHITM